MYRAGTISEMTGQLLLRAGFILVCSFVFGLIVFSVIEVFKTLVDIIRNLEKNNDILLAGALTAALVPSAAMLYWVSRAIATYLYLPIERVRQYFRPPTQL